MVLDQQDVPASVNKSAVETGSAPQVEDEPERLESLLLDDPDHEQAVEHITAQEIRVVNSRKRGPSGLMLGLLLLCILLGGGYLYLSTPQTLKSPPPRMALYVSPRLPVPARSEIDLPIVVSAVPVTPVLEPEKQAAAVTPVTNNEVSLFTVVVGPLVNDVELEQAISQLRELGLKPQQEKGRGPVPMVRLLVGVYPIKEAQEHLASLKKMVKSVFILPDGDKQAVYAGSFHQEARAQQMQNDLAQKKVDVTLVDSLIVMNGTMLIALQADEKTAREVAAHISTFGLQTQVLKKK